MSVIDYQSPSTPRVTRRWPFRLVVVTVILALVVVPLGGLTVRETQWQVDGTTGSMAKRTVWFGKFPSTTLTTSAFETRLKQMGVSYTPSWHTMSDVEYNIFGMDIFRGCGSAPPMFHFRNIDASYCKLAADDDIRALLHVIQTGSEEQQTAAIETAGDKAYGLNASISR